ncbi:MAG: hypothetical protein Q9162_005296 [Coniocarpon cinnabarinum]
MGMLLLLVSMCLMVKTSLADFINPPGVNSSEVPIVFPKPLVIGQQENITWNFPTNDQYWLLLCQVNNMSSYSYACDTDSPLQIYQASSVEYIPDRSLNWNITTLKYTLQDSNLFRFTLRSPKYWYYSEHVVITTLDNVTAFANNNTSDSTATALRIGLGVGIGVGLPILVVLLGVLALLLKKTSTLPKKRLMDTTQQLPLVNAEKNEDLQFKKVELASPDRTPQELAGHPQ